MNPSLLVQLLFAQKSPWEHLGDGLHGRRERFELMDFWPLLLLLAVAAFAVAVIVAIRKRNDMSQHCDNPNKLFRELSLAHQLDRGSQKLLWQLAEAMNLAQPAEVFLKPALYEPSKLPEQLRGEEARLQALQERLF